MGTCALCGRDAGFLQYEHESCRDRTLLLKNEGARLIGAIYDGERSLVDHKQYGIVNEYEEYFGWLAPNVEKLQYKNRKVTTGRSSGISIRLAKGLNVRAGGSAGVSTVEEYITSTDIGPMLLTDQNIYFLGAKRTEKIPLKSLTALDFQDGIMTFDDTRRRHIFRTELIAEAEFFEAAYRVHTGDTTRPTIAATNSAVTTQLSEDSGLRSDSSVFKSDTVQDAPISQVAITEEASRPKTALSWLLIGAASVPTLSIAANDPSNAANWGATAVIGLIMCMLLAIRRDLRKLSKKFTYVFSLIFLVSLIWGVVYPKRKTNNQISVAEPNQHIILDSSLQSQPNSSKSTPVFEEFGPPPQTKIIPKNKK